MVARCTVMLLLFAAAPTAMAAKSSGSSRRTASQELCTENGPCFSQRSPRWWWGLDVHSAFLSALIGQDSFALSSGLGVLAGRRGEKLGFYLQLDNTWWREPVLTNSESDEIFGGIMQGSLNLAVGMERLYSNHRMRLLLGGGLTILLRHTVLDRAGTPGFWLDLRPIGIRIPIQRGPQRLRRLILDPISASVLVPDTSGIPLVLFQFRTSVTLEFDFMRGAP